MINGSVTPFLEAIVRFRVVDCNGQTQAIDFKIDTGFTDFISLPIATVASLGLAQTSYQTVQLANGSGIRVAVHSGMVIWEGVARSVEVLAMGVDKLMGMAMLAGHDLAIRVSDGGSVSITLIP